MGSTYIKLPPSSSGGGGAVDSVNGQTGVVVLTKSSLGLGNVNNTSDATKNAATATLQNKKVQLQDGTQSAPSLTFQSDTDSGLFSSGDGNVSVVANGQLKAEFTQNDVVVHDDLTVDGNITAANYPPTGSNNAFAGYDNNGDLSAVPGFYRNVFSGGLDESLTQNPDDNVGGFSVNQTTVNFDPLQNSPSDSWTINNTNVNMDSGASGFDQGTGGEAVALNNWSVNHNGKGDTGTLVINKSYFGVGNGADPITVQGLSYSYGFGNVNDGVTMDGDTQGYGFQPSFSSGTIIPSNRGVRAFYDFTNIQSSTPNYASFLSSPQIANIQNNNSYVGVNISPNVAAVTGNAGVSGLAVNPQMAGLNANGNFQGVQMNPTITLNKGNAVGLNINMNNVTNYAGVRATLTIQDISYTFAQYGTDGNNYTIEYTDTVLAGNEVAQLSGNSITVQIESGVTTANQINAAFAASPNLSGGVLRVISGVGSNVQVATGPQSFAGGEQPGRKQAAQFDGDVRINGALEFSGNLTVGALNAFGSLNLASANPGVNSIHGLITQPTLAANQTVNGIDLLGINTAMLLTIGANSTVTSNFLGLAALGLPAVVSLGAGATVDRVAGAVFAISLDSGAGGGTVNEVTLCRALAIPNGVTTVNDMKGFEFSQPFGAVGTNIWGFYTSDSSANNYFAKNLIIGGVTGLPTNADTALEVQSKKAIKLGSVTTIEKNALTPVAGMMVYDQTLNQASYYNGTSWVNI